MTEPRSPGPEQQGPFQRKQGIPLPSGVEMRVRRLTRKLKQAFQTQEEQDKEQLDAVRNLIDTLPPADPSPRPPILVVKRVPPLPPDPPDLLEQEAEALENARAEDEKQREITQLQDSISERLLAIPAMEPHVIRNNIWKSNFREEDPHQSEPNPKGLMIGKDVKWIFHPEKSHGSYVHGYSVTLAKEPFASSENSPRIEVKVKKGKVATLYIYWRDPKLPGGPETQNHSTTTDPHEIMGLDDTNPLRSLMDYVDERFFEDRVFQPQYQYPFHCVKVDIQNLPYANPGRITIKKGKNPFSEIDDSYQYGIISKRKNYQKKNNGYEINSWRGKKTLSYKDSLMVIDTALSFIPTERA